MNPVNASYSKSQVLTVGIQIKTDQENIEGQPRPGLRLQKPMDLRVFGQQISVDQVA